MAPPLTPEIVLPLVLLVAGLGITIAAKTLEGLAGTLSTVLTFIGIALAGAAAAKVVPPVGFIAGVISIAVGLGIKFFVKANLWAVRIAGMGLMGVGIALLARTGLPIP
ncbi:MAG: hypothetical protein QF415_14550 [Candidatus Undinarchaeales archaeon]|jgi:hypothetical protein|nr:hypothetical protein [Candidatus Undinarchaeales archaeon]MDP7494294.1 hypothetical protein [Candidatus Undinarchaeales archaeon]